MLNFLSLGAGVQSTTVALMAAHGEITPLPDGAIFADTRSEPRAVYEHLRWLASPNVLPFPIHIVSKGNMRDHVVEARNSTGQRFVTIPAFTRAKKPGRYRIGRTRRQCTKEFKIEVIEAEVRRHLGLKPRQRGPRQISVTQWIGISTDEASRMKPAGKRYTQNRWPLIELSMSRWDCKRWLVKNDYPVPPKSSCTFCPYHNDAYWRDLKLNDVEAWLDALEVDEALRSNERSDRFQQHLYLHRSGQPLADVDFRSLEDLGQGDLFGNECEGVCGV